MIELLKLKANSSDCEAIQCAKFVCTDKCIPILFCSIFTTSYFKILKNFNLSRQRFLSALLCTFLSYAFVFRECFGFLQKYAESILISLNTKIHGLLSHVPETDGDVSERPAILSHFKSKPNRNRYLIIFACWAIITFYSHTEFWMEFCCSRHVLHSFKELIVKRRTGFKMEHRKSQQCGFIKGNQWMLLNEWMNVCQANDMRSYFFGLFFLQLWNQGKENRRKKHIVKNKPFFSQSTHSQWIDFYTFHATNIDLHFILWHEEKLKSWHDFGSGFVLVFSPIP